MVQHSNYNRFKTLALLGGMWAILLFIGYALSSATRMPIIMLVFALLGLAGTFYSYWNSATLALRSMQAYPVTMQDQPAMYRIVQELSARAGQPMPKLYVSPTTSPNAFATGRNPKNAAVCCTEGILALLDERELRGVLAHELMHVYNRDILISSVAAAIGGLITSLAHMFYFFGGAFQSRDSEGNHSLIGGLLVSLLAPIASMIVQMSVSRTREFDADWDGAQLAQDPLALASALRKLENGIAQAPLQRDLHTEKVGFMMISNPFGNLRNLFSTHPSTEERIRRLEKLAGY